MDKNTDDLMKALRDTDIDTYLSENSDCLDMTLQEFFNNLISETPGLTAAGIASKSCLERSYCNQIINGTKKNPSREKLIAIAIGMHFTTEKTQRMLKIAKVGQLYPKSARDSIIIYALDNKLDHMNTSELLERYNQPNIKYSRDD